MKNKTGIIFRSIFRISVIPILVFFTSAYLVLQLIDPGFINGGCLAYPENSSENFLYASYLLFYYLCFTPLLLLNFSQIITQSKIARIAILLTPITPILWWLIIATYQYYRYEGRVYLYVAITALLTAIIIIWNTKKVHSELN